MICGRHAEREPVRAPHEEAVHVLQPRFTEDHSLGIPEALEERWGDCGCSEGSDGGKEAAALDVAEHGALRANRP